MISEAAVRAARVRFVPIAMTSSNDHWTLPTALGGKSHAVNRPLALAVVGSGFFDAVVPVFGAVPVYVDCKTGASPQTERGCRLDVAEAAARLKCLHIPLQRNGASDML